MTVKEWPKPVRLVLYWVAMILLLFVMIPGALLAGIYALGLEACVDPQDVGSAVCSFTSRVAGGSALVVGVIGLGFPLIRFLQRELAPASGPQRLSHVSSHLPAELLGKRVDLLFGQELVCGRIESLGSSARVIRFGGDALTFWSRYPIRAGWMDEGDELVLVHQRVPFSSARFALAFWNGAPNPVRGIAAFVHTFGIVLSVTCMAFFSANPSPLNDLCIVVSAFAGAVSFAYLILMLRAMRALRSFIRYGSAQ
jgi:hypothetical protein